MVHGGARLEEELGDVAVPFKGHGHESSGAVVIGLVGLVHGCAPVEQKLDRMLDRILVSILAAHGKGSGAVVRGLVHRRAPVQQQLPLGARYT